MSVPFLDLRADHEPLLAELDRALGRVLRSGQYVLGEEVLAFEREAAEFLGAEYAVAVSSGSDALVCALLAANCGPGDEVVTSPFSFFATVEAILRVGATPRFADIDPDTLMLSPEATESALSARTKAILPVHLYGHAAAIEELSALAARARVGLVEDAAQAFGAALSGRSLGCFGELGCFSFFPSKPLGAAGDGGMVVTGDEALAERLRRLRTHGARARHEHLEWSGNYRLDAMQAAVLRVKLRHVRTWQRARAQWVGKYERGLQGVEAIRSLPTREGEAPCHALYTIQILDGSRDQLVGFLHERGIASAIHYPRPLYAQKALAHLEFDALEFPNTERASRQVLSLPLFASMTEQQVDSVLSAVRTFYS